MAWNKNQKLMRNFYTLLLVFTVGCTSTKQASVEESDSAEGQFQGTALVNPNRAPAWMEPPSDVANSSRIDKVHMQSKADYHFALGETYSLAGDGRKAIEEFRMTLIYDPSSSSVRTRLAQEYVREGLLSEAMEQAEVAVQRDPEAIDPRLLLGRVYTGLKMYDKAMDQYAQVLQRDPANSDAGLFTGAILAEQGRYQAAIDHFHGLNKQADFADKHVAHFYIGRI